MPIRSFCLLLLLAGLACAAPKDSTAPHAPHADDPGVGKAYAWTLLGTALPVTASLAMLASPGDSYGPLYLLSAGVVAGPSLGQLYAGSPIQAAIALGVRSAGLGLLIVGIDRGLERARCNHLNNMGDEEECEDGGGAQLLSGMLLIGGGFLYSLVDTRFSVDRARARNAARRQAKLSLDPWLAYGGPGNPLFGGRAQLRF